jgi:hypothetical protein
LKENKNYHESELEQAIIGNLQEFLCQAALVNPIIPVLQAEAFSNGEKIGFEKHIYDDSETTVMAVLVAWQICNWGIRIRGLPRVFTILLCGICP